MRGFAGIRPDAPKRAASDREAPPDAEGDAGGATGSASGVLRLFAVTWAIATLFHVFVNPRSLGLLPDPGGLGAVHAVLAAVALLVLVRPGSVRGLLALAAAHVVSACAEAPFLGNHWLLAALVSLGLLAVAGTAGLRGRRGRGLREEIAERFPPVARWCLLIAYAFAAFSKLNEGFFTPGRSCGPFYADELLSAWGLPGPGGSGPAAWAAVAAPVAVECALPVLLACRRTRHLGVLAGLGFHGVIALDPHHPFSDFSSVLLALFLLFLPPSFAGRALARRSAMGRCRRAVAVAAVPPCLILWSFDGQGTLVAVNALQFVLWVGYAGVVTATVIAYLRAARPEPEPGMLRVVRDRSAVLHLAVPLAVVLNGLTPYLELKTGFAWNMYSNLVTVDGRSNHLLVRRTWPLTGEQRRLVTVLESDDPALREYAEKGYRVPVLQLREYAGRHPSVRLRYELGGAVHDAPRIGADPLLSRPVPVWRAKLQLFRAVDAQDPPRCQDRWGAAR